MLKQMLIRSGVVIAGMVVTQTILDKLEKNYLESNKGTKNECSKEK